MDSNDNFIDGLGRNPEACQGVQKGLAKLYNNACMKARGPSSLKAGKPSDEYGMNRVNISPHNGFGQMTHLSVFCLVIFIDTSNVVIPVV